MIADKPIIDWYGLYKEKWGDLISDDAVGHPAKYSHGLIRKIYEHAIEQGYITVDSKIIDPFGGVGLGAFYAANNGLIWLGNELEDKFWRDGYKNFAIWCERFWCVCDDQEYLDLLRNYVLATQPLEDSPQIDMFTSELKDPDDLLSQIIAKSFASWDKPNKGSYCEVCGKVIVAYPVLLKGDSRFLSQVLRGKLDSILSSPPYIDSVNARSNGIDPVKIKSSYGPNTQALSDVNYGQSPNQLGNLPAGDYDAAISSPVYPDAGANETRKYGGLKDVSNRNPLNKSQLGGITNYGQPDGQLATLSDKDFDAAIASPSWAGNSGGQGEASRNAIDPGLFDRHQGGMKRGTGEGESGNIDHMMEGDFEAVVSSPPYENAISNPSIKAEYTGQGGPIHPRHYSLNDNQLGNQTGPTFWQASKEILLETNKCLKVGGYGFWVVKSYIKLSQIVPFPDMWCKLVEVCGFEHIETIYAWQTEDKGTQVDLAGEAKKKVIKHKSFFRIIYERNNPENAIDFEVVLVLRKL